MPRVTFTDLGLRSLKAQKGQRLDVWDAKQPGFGVRVSPNGTKTFVLMYWLNGRKHRMTLGHFPSKSLSDARADLVTATERMILPITVVAFAYCAYLTYPALSTLVNRQ